METPSSLTPSLRVVAPLDTLVIGASSWRSSRQVSLVGHVRETALGNDPHARADEAIMLRSARCQISAFAAGELRGADLAEPHRTALRELMVATADGPDPREQAHGSFAVGVEGSELVLALPALMFEDLYEVCRLHFLQGSAAVGVSLYDLMLGPEGGQPMMESFLAGIERAPAGVAWRALHARRVEVAMGDVRRIDTARRR